MLVLIAGIIWLVWSKSQQPAIDFDITPIVAIMGFFAFVSGYIAFNRSNKKLGSAENTVVSETTSFLHLIVRSVAFLVMILFGFGTLFFIPLLFQYPEPNIYIFMALNVLITIVSAIIYFISRKPKKSDDIRDDLSNDKRKNDPFNEDN